MGGCRAPSAAAAAAAGAALLASAGVASAKTVSSYEENKGGSIGLPIFLALATLLQIWFLYKGLHLVVKCTTDADRSKGVAITALAFADFAWACPCFLHCVMNYHEDGFWGGKHGCDVQGYYSLLACFSTMFYTVQITWYSWIIVNHDHQTVDTMVCMSRLPTRSQAIATSACLYALAMFLSAIPFFPGPGGFVYTGDGFCFMDYYDVTMNTIFAIVLVSSFTTVWALTVMIYLRLTSPKYNGRVEPQAANSMILIASCFTLYYMLGIPLVLLGYMGTSYPVGLQIGSGLLAHGAETINPFIYGLMWCKWFIAPRSVPTVKARPRHARTHKGTPKKSKIKMAMQAMTAKSTSSKKSATEGDDTEDSPPPPLPPRSSKPVEAEEFEDSGLADVSEAYAGWADWDIA